MEQQQLIPHLFRTEYRKITSVLCKLFGITHIQVAEDIASDTFLAATEVWGLKGLPENPVAWLYTVAKNKAKNHLKHDTLFRDKIAKHLLQSTEAAEELNIDLSEQNIADSQLQMIFAICHPAISEEAQIALALRILCGFGIDEIADAFLTSKETINKRLVRAKEKLRDAEVKIVFPQDKVRERLATVLTTLYLLFNEGYYSASNQITLRKDLCSEAMRLTHLLTENPGTDLPEVSALLSLMSFQASRFEARTTETGSIILYDEQDEQLWNRELIAQGKYFLERSATGDTISKYHIEAGIAQCHTVKADTPQKWEHILQLYNKLLIIEYSPIAALNRTYALAKANGKQEAIAEAEKLDLQESHLYHALLGELYSDIDNAKAIEHYADAISITKTEGEKELLRMKMDALR